MKNENSPNKKVRIKRVTPLNSLLLVVGIVALAALGLAVRAYVATQQSQRAVVQHLGSQFNLQRSDVAPADRAAIETLLRKAGEFEFGLYKKAEHRDTTGFSEFFIPQSPAYKKIWQAVTGVHSRGWSLNNPTNASYAAVLTVEVVNSDGLVAEAVTRENWYLDYVQAGTNSSIHTYSQLNTQYYQVRKTPAGWRIYLNHYPTTNIIFKE